MEVDFETATEFLSFFGDSFTFQTFDDTTGKRPELISTFHGSFDQNKKHLAELNCRSAGVFFTVNETNLVGRKKEDITTARAIWVEDDRPRLSARDDFPLKPSLIVKSSTVEAGNKYHYYWLTETDLFPEWEAVMHRMVKEWGCDNKAKDLSRVMRIPGFYHCKISPQMVELVDNNGRTYHWSDVVAVFTPLSERSEKRSHQKDQNPNDAVRMAESGEDYHGSHLKLSMRYANALRDTELVEACLKIHHNRVPVGERDERWESRLNEIPHIARTSVSALLEPRSLQKLDIYYPEYDYSCVPETILKAATEISRFCFMPLSYTVFGALACVGASHGNTVRIHERAKDGFGIIIHPNMIIVPTDPTGAYKSATFKALAHPLIEYEKMLISKHEENAKLVNATNELVDMDIKKITKRYQNEKQAQTMNDTALQLALLQGRKADVPPKPSLIEMDITDEAAALACWKQGGSIAVMTAEGDEYFQQLMGKYLDGKGSGDLFFIKAATGDTYKTDRITREGFTIEHPCMNGLLFVQPDILVPFFKDDRLRSKGVIARFEILSHPSRIGTRFIEDYGDIAPDTSLLEEYNLRITNLLDLRFARKEIRHIQLTEKSKLLWKDIYNRNEKMLGLSRQHQDELNKITSKTLKVAWNFQSYEIGFQSPYLKEEYVERADVLMSQQVTNMLAMRHEAEISVEINDARVVHGWICSSEERWNMYRDNNLTATSLVKYHKGRSKDEIEGILGVLTAYKWLTKSGRTYFVNGTFEQWTAEARGEKWWR